MLFNRSKTPQEAPVAPVRVELIFDVKSVEFESRVLKASMERPVIVDFWAPWCEPCKQLGPALERAVIAANGAVLMAKVNIEENPDLAQALRIQSIPTVYAFVGGKPVDVFQGAVPEGQIKAFIDKLVQAGRSIGPDALNIPEALQGAAQLMGEGDLETAQAIYTHILQQDPKSAAAYVGIVRVMIATGQLEQAAQLVKNAPPEIANNPAFGEAKTAVELATAAPQGDSTKLKARLEQNPADHEARYELATAEFAAGNRVEAIDHLLEIVRRKRDWNEDAARKQLVRFFEALGHADPLTVESRKKLSSILFS